MKYSTVLDRLQKLTKNTPSVGELSKATGLTEKNLYARRTHDREFSEEEIDSIEKFYNITLLSSDDCIEIQHIHINPSCGSGTVVMDEPEITPIKLGKKLIESILRVSDVNNLRTFTASGDSMSDTIDDGNLLLVDMGRKDFNNGGIFILQKNNEWFVKRLQLRFSGELDIISDNPKYKTDTIKPNDDIEIMIKGKVIKNLSKGL